MIQRHRDDVSLSIELLHDSARSHQSGDLNEERSLAGYQARINSPTEAKACEPLEIGMLCQRCLEGWVARTGATGLD